MPDRLLRVLLGFQISCGVRGPSPARRPQSCTRRIRPPSLAPMDGQGVRSAGSLCAGSRFHGSNSARGCTPWACARWFLRPATSASTLRPTLTMTKCLKQRHWSPMKGRSLPALRRSGRLQRAPQARLPAHRRRDERETDDAALHEGARRGPHQPFALLAVIGDECRFERPEKLVAYIELNPASAKAARARTSNSAWAKEAVGIPHLLPTATHLNFLPCMTTCLSSVVKIRKSPDPVNTYLSLSLTELLQ